ncbi:MAG: metallophosphoesterase [Candidatus Deferrimicrobiaceae bacterium]
MSLFLITFLLVYGSVHAYALLKAKSALGFGWGTAAVLAPALVALTCAPLIIYFLGKHGMEGAARAVSWVGYTWMGLLFFFLWTNLAVDAVNLVLRLAGAISGKGASAYLLAGKGRFFALVALCLALGAYSFFEARDIGIERVTIRTDKLPASTPRVRVAQISDVHLGLIVRNAKAEKIAELIRSVDPDILVSTGDLVDAEINHLEGLAEIFGKIHPRLGKFAVTGNHEFYAGIDQALQFTQRAGFSVLRGEAVQVGEFLRIAGIDDTVGAALGAVPGRREAEVLSGNPNAMFTILLKHRPRISKSSRGLFDLQLSGHTHNGQIFPFRYVVGRPYPNLSGLFPLGGSFLYTSRGTGTWGPPMRFLSPPIVTVIDIERAPRKEGGHS